MTGAGVRAPGARELAATSRAIFRAGPVLLRTLQHLRPYICPFGEIMSHVPPGSALLDVGCGGGLFIHLLNAAGRIERAVGFDVSAPAIELAKSATAQGKASLEFVRLDAADPWPAGRFTVVSMIDVLHHVPARAQREVFERAGARVEPGGRLVYKDMTSRGVVRPAMNRLHDLVLSGQWIHYVPLGLARAWGVEAGLAPVIERSIGTLWYGHELIVFEKRR